MSKKKERRLAMQAEREAKLKEREESGIAIKVHYEEKKKHKNMFNRKMQEATVEDEAKKRQEVLDGQIMVFRRMLPVILPRIAKIKDLRRSGSVKHKMRVLMLYGILIFVHQMESRREVNRKMTGAAFVESMKAIFPEIDSTPHADTLVDVLKNIDVNNLEDIAIDLIRELVRKKKFRRSLQEGRYIIAIDGTGKYSRDWQYAKECLHRKKGDSTEEKYFVYVLEAALVLGNGVTFPFMSEFLENGEYDFSDEKKKQDCELKAFKRLANRIKKKFPKLKLTLVMDGLYPNGPIFEICRNKKWEYMIILKDGSLSEVWEDAEGIMKLETGNMKRQMYGDRQQDFWWANRILYTYSKKDKNGKDIIAVEKVHVVVCKESWVECTNAGDVKKNVKFSWVSSKEITTKNVHRRCNLIGRYRWYIENNLIQAEKCRGYNYKHSYSYNWNAMKGFHYLMHIAHILNNLVLNLEYMEQYVEVFGIKGTLEYIYETWIGRWIDKERIKELLECDRYCLKFLFDSTS